MELRNRSGEIVWSYLATPGGGEPDVAKDVSRRIAKHLAEALRHDPAPTSPDPPPQPSIVLSGAGATFPDPIYEKWFARYGQENPGVQIHYNPVGSDTGVRELLAGRVDFGEPDSPVAVREVAPGPEDQYIFLPSVTGAVVPIVNLPGPGGDIQFTPDALAGIYLGKIKKWNDPVLKKSNPGRRLPDLDIVVVHRSDGSGTSYAWSDFLSKTNADGKVGVGSSLNPQWRVGRAAAGNDGVAKLVKELGGSIGYVEYIYALRNHLSYGRVRNRNGDFVAANLESIQLAASRPIPDLNKSKLSLVDAPGMGAYPIASFIWIVIPAHFADDQKRQAIASFLKWMLGTGQRQAAALGYAALPPDVIREEEKAIEMLQ